MNNNLKSIRKSRKLSQQDMADKLGVKVSRYGSWERNERMPSLEQAFACAVILDCSIDALVGHDVPATFTDPREAELHRVWCGLDYERQNRLIATAHDMELAKSNGNTATRRGSMSA